MYYGLNNIIKKILPKGLFYRSLLIVATPIILLQIVITIVFFDSLWIKANKGMTRSLVSEIKTLFDVYRSEDKKNIQFLTNSYKKNFDFVINIKKNEELPTTKSDRRFSPMDRSLRREMKSVFDSSYWFDTVTYIDLVDLRINNILDKIKKNALPEEIYIGNALVNLKKLDIKINNKIKKINPQEKKVLEKMLESPGKIFSRDDIGKIINISKERTIDVIITRLRKKIEFNPKNPKYLQTIRGSGYVLWIE